MPEPDDEEAQEVIELTKTYSAREVLRQKDFAQLTTTGINCRQTTDGDACLADGHAHDPALCTGPRRYTLICGAACAGTCGMAANC